MKHIAVLLMLLAAAGCGKKSEAPKAEAPPRGDAASKSVADGQAQFEAAQRKIVADAKAQREEEVRANAPERERIEREYPDSYRKLAAKVGADLNDCVVEAKEQPTGVMPGSPATGKLVVLTARCGPSMLETMHGS